MTTPTGTPGHVMLSKDGHTAYRVEEDGRWTKLPALTAANLIEQRRAQDEGHAVLLKEEHERVLRQRAEREQRESHALNGDFRRLAEGKIVRAAPPQPDGVAVHAGGAEPCRTRPAPVLASNLPSPHGDAPAGPPPLSFSEEGLMVNPRDITVAIPLRKDGEPALVRLTHRPSGKSYEGSGEDYASARQAAQRAFEAGLDELGEAEV